MSDQLDELKQLIRTLRQANYLMKELKFPELAFDYLIQLITETTLRIININLEKKLNDEKGYNIQATCNQCGQDCDMINGIETVKYICPNCGVR